MNKFQYVQPKSLSEASNLLKEKSLSAIPYAGGTDALDLIKHDILTPEYVVNLKLLPNLNKINFKKGKGLNLGALVKIADIADDKNIRDNYPILYQAAKNVASPQLRNMGTVGGNICQRPRCWYFREDFNCLRKDGGECFAYLGENKYHCIIGGGPCYMVHPSDLAVALLALNSLVVIYSQDQERTIPLEEFFILPEKNLLKENILQSG
jgi:xanthine dehydrogenase YagS FAD-binding subunit